MVSQRENIHATLNGALHQLGGAQQSVGAGRMTVQIKTHENLIKSKY
jgi:hypothetical protein